MREATLQHVDGTAMVVMTAAVADYRPAAEAPQKLKKDALGDAPALTLTKNPDILAELKGRAPAGRSASPPRPRTSSGTRPRSWRKKGATSSSPTT